MTLWPATHYILFTSKKHDYGHDYRIITETGYSSFIRWSHWCRTRMAFQRCRLSHSLPCRLRKCIILYCIRIWIWRKLKGHVTSGGAGCLRHRIFGCRNHHLPKECDTWSYHSRRIMGNSRHWADLRNRNVCNRRHCNRNGDSGLRGDKRLDSSYWHYHRHAYFYSDFKRAYQKCRKSNKGRLHRIVFV